MHVQLRVHAAGRFSGRIVRGRVPVRRLLPTSGRRKSARRGRAECVHGRGRHVHRPDARLALQRPAAAIVPTAGGRHHTDAPQRVGRAKHLQAGRSVR